MDFLEYCKSFYSLKKGIYPIATDREIEQAIKLRMKDKTLPFEGDSVDRERVREIIEQAQLMRGWSPKRARARLVQLHSKRLKNGTITTRSSVL